MTNDHHIDVYSQDCTTEIYLVVCWSHGAIYILFRHGAKPSLHIWRHVWFLVFLLTPSGAHAITTSSIRSRDKHSICPAILRRRVLTMTWRMSMPSLLIISSSVVWFCYIHGYYSSISSNKKTNNNNIYLIWIDCIAGGTSLGYFYFGYIRPCFTDMYIYRF